ncbi:hypothetical protein BGZ93_003030, partial [Podila epicladia]
MYVQLTIELITQAMKLFSQLTGAELTQKQAKMVYKSLVKDDNVDKHYFCGAICTKSQNICMKEVKEESMHCYVHDPENKCQGVTLKGQPCGSVAKVGEDYCYRHL